MQATKKRRHDKTQVEDEAVEAAAVDLTDIDDLLDEIDDLIEQIERPNAANILEALDGRIPQAIGAWCDNGKQCANTAIATRLLVD